MPRMAERYQLKHFILLYRNIPTCLVNNFVTKVKIRGKRASIKMHNSGIDAFTVARPKRPDTDEPQNPQSASSSAGRLKRNSIFQIVDTLATIRVAPEHDTGGNSGR